MTLQSYYYAFAIIGVVIATAINIALFIRNKPDKLKAAVQAGVAPLLERMDKLEQANTDQNAHLQSQDVRLERIDAEMRMAPSNNDLRAIQGSINSLAKTSGAIEALQRRLEGQYDRMNQFLLEDRRG
jgi:hypothetical protein